MEKTKKRLLLIVDDWELLERYEERFSPGFEKVFCAPLGSEGLRIAHEEKPEIVLLHLAFENMTNEEACAALRADAQTRNMVIIAVGGTQSLGMDFWLGESSFERTIEDIHTRLKVLTT